MIDFYKFLKSLGLVWGIYKNQNIGAPILITQDGTVIDGNSRLRIAKRLGFQEIPVVRVDARVEHCSLSELKEAY